MCTLRNDLFEKEYFDCSEMKEELRDIVLNSEWKEFRNPDFNILSDKLNENVIFDGRNIYDKKIIQNGFDLFQIGC